jgi:enoyl-CoA hydratase/carnithine racemase
MDYQQILYDIDSRVLTLTLNRPEKLNAFTETMRAELCDALDRADADDDVRAIIVTGAGRAFCAGADLSAGPRSFDREAGGPRPGETRWRDGGGLLTLRLFNCKKPVIAAVNGAAVGVGVTMQLAMDIRIASSAARFGFVFNRRGIMPEACSGWFLPRIVGIAQALEWVYSGRVFPAEEALAGRLVSKVVPPDELLPVARAIAREIAENTSAVSTALSRQLMWRMLGAEHPMAAHRIDSRGVPFLGRSADGHEGVASFLEKRPPRFTLGPAHDMPDFFPWWQDPEFE